ncbi:MAG: FkbM family methyltransferase [Anaerolineales bacterium]|nr:FkbM family methyltransferase [Anaerolineales bacterium]
MLNIHSLIRKFQQEELQEHSFKIAVVMGNGPSAKLLDFGQLRCGHVATVGMNAAYRYWDEINFRPTYYICMDTVVLQSHAEAVYRLVNEGRIKKFFLRDEIKDIYPALAESDRILWYSQAKEEAIFQTHFVTTGSWALRWMAYEGMRITAAVGIDANYMELLPEAKKLGGDDNLELEINETPRFNPNYFFAGYQQTGDKYNIPNDPKYLESSGGLVHVDALKAVSKDLEWHQIQCKIFDLSPISNHGVFEKIPMGCFFDRLRLSVVTSFREETNSAAAQINIEILIMNLKNPFVKLIILLFEGDWGSFIASFSAEQQAALKQAIDRNQLNVVETSQRPSYWHLFNLANEFGADSCSVQNSDIYLPMTSVEKMIIDGFFFSNRFHAITRWNITINGIFLQSLVPTPPWSEINLSEFTIKEKNYFSYDAYFLDVPIVIPESIKKVLLGSLGCDTALAAIFKASGYSVTNPCLRYEMIHVDDKPRNYSSGNASSELNQNIDAFEETIRNSFKQRVIWKSLNKVSSLRRHAAWLGHPNVINPWHSIYRALGATVWSGEISSVALHFKKLSITCQQLELEVGNLSFEPSLLMKEMEESSVFLEWELSGFEHHAHVVELLSKSNNYEARLLAERLATYPWLSMIHVDKATPEEVAALFDSILVIKGCLSHHLEANTSDLSDLSILATNRSILGSKAVFPVNSMISSLLNEGASSSSSSRVTTGVYLSSPQKVLIIDPDAKNWSGHYMAYNEKLSSQLQKLGADVQVVCRKDIDSEIIASRPNYLPTLSAHSWDVGNCAENEKSVLSFKSEIKLVLDRAFKECDQSILLYMYCGSVGHAQVLRDFLQRYPKLCININLFWLSFTLSHASAQNWRSLFEWAYKETDNERIIVTLPTMELCDELAEYTGCVLPVAPHPSTGVSDQKFSELSVNNDLSDIKRKLHVLFPGAPRLEKGYLISLECAKILTSYSEFHPIIRYAPTFSTPKELADPLAGMPDDLEVVEGELTDQVFLSLFSRSDIVVLPYTPDAFSKRTSGLLIDAIYHGVPCVVVKGTWLGNIVQQYGGGIVIDEASANQLADAVKVIAENYTDYRSQAIQAGIKYFSGNSWDALSRFLLNPTGLQPLLIPSPDQLSIPIVGPFLRQEKAHWDETNGVDQLFASAITGSTMIDVGAHHGFALAPFLSKEWRIYAFEPDEKNRAKLLERLASQKNKALVNIDTRCVSNKSVKDVAFYSSEQSTGISGLSAFHESHVEAQRVDTVTLTEFFEGKPLPVVDFLKIDTEGHDLFVLQGFPWDRTKPAVIECEFEDTKTVPLGYTFDDLANFLVDKGYTVYVSEWHPIIRYGIRHDWRQLMRYPCELADSKGWGNLLAFRDPIDEKDLVAAVRKVLKVGTGETAKPAAVPPAKTSVTAAPAVGTKPVAVFLAQPGGRAFKVVPGTHFTELSANQWRYTHSDAAQKLWQAVFDVAGSTAGRSFVGGIRLKSNRAMTVSVSIGRHGSSEYEGASKRITLAPGVAQSVQVRKEFAKPHDALRLQVEVLQLEGGGTADLTIDVLSVNETLASIRRHLPESDLNLRVANRLFRDGNYSMAMGLYLLLNQQRPLKMYADNAHLAARKLGMAAVETLDELMQHVA